MLDKPKLASLDQVDAGNSTGSARSTSAESRRSGALSNASFTSDSESGRVMEPIAVVGLSFKFPDGVETSEALWDYMLEQRNASKEVPSDRYNIDAFYDADPSKISKISTKKAHFLAGDVRNFDAPFFSIPPLEAGSMDPQQRCLMETTYHALENAGLSMKSVAGSNTSVHVGCFAGDFVMINWRDPAQIPKYSVTGTTSSILSNRLSWFYDLRGASLTVDTACSSSMVALDLACHGIWNKSSEMAIVAGANLLYSPESSIALSNLGMLSPDGKCFSFDHRANGYARGEGFAVLVLKPLSRAIQDGDTIRSLIRSTGTNQDGHTNGGIAQPSPIQQAALIRETYRKANLDMAKTRFFEAHGTGTPIGDPIEASALGEAFRPFRSPESPLYVGAIKSNFGHLEGASGLAGVIKTILVLENGIIPPNSNFEQLSPKIAENFKHLHFPSQPITWPDLGVRRGSVNSFGFGGTNAHAILDDVTSYFEIVATRRSLYDQIGPPDKANIQIPSPSNQSRLIVLSAADENGVLRQIQGLSHYLITRQKSAKPTFFDDLTFTLNQRRSMLPWKSYTVVDPKDLSAFTESFSQPVRTPSLANLGFVFSGQGAQWYAMGRALLLVPLIHDSIQKSQQILSNLGCEWSITEELNRNDQSTKVNAPEYSQALCTIIQVALVEMLSWLGARPSLVFGHSSGEIAAAFCAGFISHESAIKIAYHRGVLASKLAQNAAESHTMASIGLPESDAAAILNSLGKENDAFEPASITISCINSPKNVTVSGPVSQIDVLVDYVNELGVFGRKLVVGVGYHSSQMSRIATEYRELLGDLRNGSFPPDVVMVSSVDGERLTGETARSADYWVRNMTSPVQFNRAAQRCLRKSNIESAMDSDEHGEQKEKEISVNLLIELGPHSALQGPLRDIIKSVDRADEVSYSTALVRKQDALLTLQKLAGFLFVRNIRIDMQRLHSLVSDDELNVHPVPDLPRYQFNHSSTYWEESRSNRHLRFREEPRNPLLGTYLHESSSVEPKWKFLIRNSELPWLKDHKVNGSILYPGAGIIVMAIEACKALHKGQTFVGFELREVLFTSSLIIPPTNEAVEVHISMKKIAEDANRGHDFQITVYKQENFWERVCHGSIKPDYGRVVSKVDNGHEAEAEKIRINEIHRNTTSSYTYELPPDILYQNLRERADLEFGPSFRALHNIRCNLAGSAIANLKPLSWLETSGMTAPDSFESITVHPATLDAIFHSGFAALQNSQDNKRYTTLVTRAGRMWITSKGIGTTLDKSYTVHASSEAVTRRLTSCEVSVVESSGEVSAKVFDLELITMARADAGSRNTNVPKTHCHFIDWKVDFDMTNLTTIDEYCQQQRPALADPIEFYRDIETMALSFSHQALEKLKIERRPVCNEQIRHVEWLRGQLERDLRETLPEERDERRAEVYSKENLDRLVARYKDYNKQSELYCKIGKCLDQILAGDLNPLEVIFNDEALITHFYEEMNSTSTAWDGIRAYLEVLTHKTPNLKFLEIGAGTGATTGRVLGYLKTANGIAHYGQYTFTDISPFFLEAAKSRFSEEAGMKYAVLDISVDPYPNGFKEHEYDVIIAALVLHATPNLEKTLSNVHKLLKPGGKLIFMEMTVPDITRTAFAFGLLNGWWLSTEEYRTGSPCITEEQWDGLLRQTGFTGNDLAFSDYSTKKCQGWSILVSTAVDAASKDSVPKPSVCILTPNSSATQVEVSESVQDNLKDAGIIVESASTLDQNAGIDNFKEKDIVLLDVFGQSFINDMDPETFNRLRNLITVAGRVTWITGGGGAYVSPGFGSVNGLCRVCRLENSGTTIMILALDDSMESKGTLTTDSQRHIVKVLKNVLSSDGPSTIEPEYRVIDNTLHVGRLYEAPEINNHIFERTMRPTRPGPWSEGPPKKLQIRRLGLLDTIEFAEDESLKKALGPNEIQVEVKAIGVNFKECLTLLGRVNTDDIGSEFSGIVLAIGSDVTEHCVGDNVFGAHMSSYRSIVRVQSSQIAKMPEGMSFVSAASIPTAFATAYYCLYEVARLKKDETILIQAAAGGTGQAAVQMALAIGAEVFVAVGSLEKKVMLMEKYGIAEDHVFYSRDTSFADGIQRMTSGRGVDVVLNSLSGDGLIAAWECIAHFGRFIEIGRKDIDSRGNLPMAPFIRNASFSGVDLASIVGYPVKYQKLMAAVLELFKTKQVQTPYPITVYPVSEVEKAFRLLQSGKSMGKIVIEVTGDAIVPTVASTSSNYALESNATYVIAGGLGGIGRGIAQWLVSRGAKHLMLISRSGVSKEPAAQELVKELETQGIEVAAPKCDISDLVALNTVIKQYSEDMPPIKGCIQGAMVLRDANFKDMTYNEWKETTLPKIQGSWNLHKVLPTGMDFFVTLSSVCGIFGNNGQANYAAGNTFQDALVGHRRALGEKAIALDLGLIKEVGFLAENTHLADRLLRLRCFTQFGQDELLSLLDYYCDAARDTTEPFKGQVVSGLELPANITAVGAEVPILMRGPLFRHMAQIGSDVNVVASTSHQALDLKILFEKATTKKEALDVVTEAMKVKLSRLLGIEYASIVIEERIDTLGVDSLVGAETRNWLSQETGIEVPLFEILEGGSISSIAQTVVAKSAKHT